MKTFELFAVVAVLIAITGCDSGATGTNSQATSSLSPSPSPTLSSVPVSASEKSALFQACTGGNVSIPGAQITSAQLTYSGSTQVCKVQTKLTPVNTNISPSSVPFMGPDTGGGYSPFDTGISFWANDTIQSIVAGGQYSSQGGPSAFSAGLCSGNLNNMSGSLFGQIPGMGNSFLIGNNNPTSVSGDGDLFVGLDATASAAACWENVSLSADVLRCVDASGSTYLCSNTTGIVATGCASLSQQMSFSGYAAYVDSANIFAGSQYGSQLAISVGGAVSGNQFVNTVMPPVDNYASRTTSDLSYMGLNITSTGGNSGSPVGAPYTGTYPGTTGAQAQTNMIQGSFQLSAVDWSYLQSMFQTVAYPTTGLTTLQNILACDISINSGIYFWNTGQGQGTLYGGYITMTVNGQLLSFKI